MFSGDETNKFKSLPTQQCESFTPEQRAFLISLFEAFRKELVQDLHDEIDSLKKEADLKALALLDTHQTCELLNISSRKLDQLIGEGELRPLRIGTKRLFSPSQIESFLRRCER